MAYSTSGSRVIGGGSISTPGQVLGANVGGVTPGQVLGAVTGLGAGAEVLPRTGIGSVVFYLVLVSMVAAAAIVLSFVVTRIIKAWF